MRLLSVDESQYVVGGSDSSDPLIIMAGIIGVSLFVIGFFPLALA